MDKIFPFIIFLVPSLLFSSCTAQAAPVAPPPDTSMDLPASPATVTVTKPSPRDPVSTVPLPPGPLPTSPVAPSAISGEFVLTNTSAPGMEVGVERIAIILEYRHTTADPWEEVGVDCAFDPPAPMVLKTELVVQYKCQVEQQLSSDAKLRTTAEVELFGSEEIFKLEVEPH